MRQDRVDVSNKERMRRFAEDVFAEYGRIDLLVNNAGVTITADFEEHTLEDWSGSSASTSGASCTAASSSCRI